MSAANAAPCRPCSLISLTAASARSTSPVYATVADPLAMTRRGSADLSSGPGKLDLKPAGRLPRAAACRSSADP